MGLFSSIKDKIMNIGKPKSNKTTTELQFDKAMNLMENANGVEAVEILERIAETGIVDPQYKELGMEALHLIKVDRYPAIIGAAHGRSIYEK